MTIAIVAHGRYVPERILDNDFFVNSQHNPYKVYIGADNSGNPVFKTERTLVDNEKILKITGGIKERRAISEGEDIVDLIERAYAKTNFPAEELRGIFIGSISDDIYFPSIACRVQVRIGAKNVRNSEDIRLRRVLAEKKETAKKDFEKAREEYKSSKEELKAANDKFKQFKESGNEAEMIAEAKKTLLSSVDRIISHLQQIKSQIEQNEQIEESRASAIINGENNIIRITEKIISIILFVFS